MKPNPYLFLSVLFESANGQQSLLGRSGVISFGGAWLSLKWCSISFRQSEKVFAMRFTLLDSHRASWARSLESSLGQAHDFITNISSGVIVMPPVNFGRGATVYVHGDTQRKSGRSRLGWAAAVGRENLLRRRRPTERASSRFLTWWDVPDVPPETLGTNKPANSRLYRRYALILKSDWLIDRLGGKQTNNLAPSFPIKWNFEGSRKKEGRDKNGTYGTKEEKRNGGNEWKGDKGKKERSQPPFPPYQCTDIG
jgi:hypothetical protein